MDKGILTISIDLELGWGYHDLGNYDRFSNGLTERSYIDKILTILEKHRVEITWAIVGHLFLEKCSGIHFPELYDREWFSSDPGTDLNQDPLWYGSDIIDKILQSTENHDIGSHSFSHIDYSKCSREQVEADIKECQRLAANYGIRLESFVFPRNVVGNLEILRNNGFKIFRGKREDRFYHVIPGGRFIEALIYSINGPPLFSILVEEGLLNIPGSIHFIPHNKGVQTRIIQKILSRGLDIAVKEKKILHIWAHLFDFRNQDSFIILDELLKKASSYREKGLLEIKTMNDISKSYYMVENKNDN